MERRICFAVEIRGTPSLDANESLRLTFKIFPNDFFFWKRLQLDMLNFSFAVLLLFSVSKKTRNLKKKKKNLACLCGYT